MEGKKRNKLLTWVEWAGRRKIYSFVRISTEMSIQRGGKGEGKKRKTQNHPLPSSFNFEAKQYNSCLSFRFL